MGIDSDLQERAKKKEAFTQWLEQPAARMMMSMIPAGEKTEVLETLLQETFKAGFTVGSGATAKTFLEAIFKNIDKREQGKT